MRYLRTWIARSIVAAIFGTALLPLVAGAATSTVPASVVRFGATSHWPLYGNGANPDCTIAAMAHEIEAVDLEIGDPAHRPSYGQVMDAFFALMFPPANAQWAQLGDVTDTSVSPWQGQVANVLDYWRVKGIGGHKLLSYFQIPLSDKAAIETAIYEFGGVYVGARITRAAMAENSQHQTWSVVSRPGGTVGEHAFDLIGYTPQYLYAVTWSGIQRITWNWWLRYGLVADAVFPEELATMGHGPLGTPTNALEADFGALEQSVGVSTPAIDANVQFADGISDAFAGTTADTWQDGLTASGGSGLLTFSVVGGSLPPGVSLQRDGAIVGQASSVGTYTAQVQATDSAWLSSSPATVQIEIFPAGSFGDS